MFIALERNILLLNYNIYSKFILVMDWWPGQGAGTDLNIDGIFLIFF